MNCNPQLRFKEFGGEWKDTFLKELLSFKNGLNASKEKYGKGIKFINVLDILENSYINYDKILDSVDATDEQIENYNVSYGDVVFQRSSETREEVGLTNVYLDKNKDCIFGGFVIRGKKIANYNPFFLKVLLSTSTIRKEITSRSGGSTRYNIGQNSLEKIEIHLPTIEEQKKIAIFLLNLDEKIAILKEKLMKWELFKKGIMQQLFSQELRFKDKNDKNYPMWEEKKLNEIGEIITGNTPPTKNQENFSETGFLWVTPTDIGNHKYVHSTERKLTEKGIEKGRFIPKNCVLVTCIASIGKNCILPENGSCNQQINSIIPFNMFNYEFIYYLMENNVNKLKSFAGITATPILNKNDFGELIFKFPILKEQVKIAEFLDNIDEKINDLENKLEKANKFKKGLLQKMFC